MVAPTTVLPVEQVSGPADATTLLDRTQLVETERDAGDEDVDGTVFALRRDQVPSVDEGTARVDKDELFAARNGWKRGEVE